MHRTQGREKKAMHQVEQGAQVREKKVIAADRPGEKVALREGMGLNLWHAY